MNKDALIKAVTERMRGCHDRPVVQADVAALLAALREVVVEQVLLRADKVNLPGLGQFHATWIGPEKKSLFAGFDYDKRVEAAIAAQKR